MNTLSKILEALPVKVETTSSGAYTWTTLKYDNGYFLMTIENKRNGSTGGMTSYGTYIGISNQFTINLPDVGQTEIINVQANVVGNAGYSLLSCIYQKDLYQITANYIRLGSTASAAGLTYQMLVIGKWGGYCLALLLLSLFSKKGVA